MYFGRDRTAAIGRYSLFLLTIQLACGQLDDADSPTSPQAAAVERQRRSGSAPDSALDVADPDPERKIFWAYPDCQDDYTKSATWEDKSHQWEDVFGWREDAGKGGGGLCLDGSGSGDKTSVYYHELDHQLQHVKSLPSSLSYR